MTLDDLIALARNVARDIPDGDSDAGQLAIAVLALLVVDQPCGFDERMLVQALPPNQEGHVLLDVTEQEALWPDEAQWCAVEILRAVEKARGEK